MQFCFRGILRRGKAQGTEVRSLAARRAGLVRDATRDRRLHCESAGRVLRRDRDGADGHTTASIRPDLGPGAPRLERRL